LLTIAAPVAFSQQSPTQPAPARAPYSALKEIHVDSDCRILPAPDRPPVGDKDRPYHDPVVCHLETILSSGHREETVVGNELRRSDVRINEQEYVLQNIRTEPVIFVVEQYVPAGWTVDSDPQPKQVEGTMALFVVNAQPHEIVRLHVGLRHAKELKPKILKTQ
jgi:hypothetical protein